MNSRKFSSRNIVKVFNSSKVELKVTIIMSCDSNNGQKCNSRNKGKAVIVNGQMYSE